MQKNVTFVTGRAGAGKSLFFKERMRALLDAGERVLVLVPEQFTFETERELTEVFPGGLYNVSVFSFTTLARRVLKKSGERSVFLSPEGMRMVVRKSAEESAASLKAFSGVAQSPGFAEKCGALFSMFKRFEITPEALYAAAEKLPEGALLKNKLYDLSLLYGRTREYLLGRYLDDEDALFALLRLLPSSFVTERHVFIDGFDLLTGQIYRIVASLMEHAKSVSVSFRLDVSPRCRDASVFFSERRAYERLFSEAKNLNLSPNVIRLPKENGLADARSALPALRHLEKEGFSCPFAPYAGKPDGIALFAASGRMAEADALSDAVLRAAQSGIRYRDMAVVATDMGAYLPLVSRAFHAREIPFFTDVKHPLSGYPAPRLLLFALRAVSRGFASSDMAELVKTGLCGVERDAAELFENYLIAYGIRGNAFFRPFTRGETPPEAEAARVTLTEPLKRLQGRLAEAKTVASKTEALYGYLEELSVFQKQSELVERLKRENRLELASENAQVFNHIMEVLSQLHTVMGDTRVSNARFAAVLSEGFDACEVGAIPATADQVLFGSVGRTRARSVRALFIVGANEGAFPLSVPDEEMIDDRELNKLRELGVNPWDSSKDKGAVALADVYSAVSKPTELLYLSYPMSLDANPAPPCALIDRVKALFPTLKEETDVAAPLSLSSLQSAFLSLTHLLRRYADTGEEFSELAPLYARFYKDEAYKNRLENVEQALFFNNSPEPFGRELALLLYGNSFEGSATRLETFNACPFKHFARYGLRIAPRKEYKERTLDEGIFLHEALSLYMDELLSRRIEPARFTKEQCEALVDELLPPLIASHNHGVLLDTARAMLRCGELARAVKATAWAATRQLALGSFTVVATELPFGTKDASLPAIEVELHDGTRYRITGKIDRLDAFENGETTYFRVIDYKSGGLRFDFAELFHGLKLQLPLYARAALAAKDAAKTAGLYYLHVREPVLNGEFEEESAFEAELFKQFRLKGLTLSDPEVVRATAGSDKDFQVIPTKNSTSLADASLISAVLSYAGKKTQDTLELLLSGRAETAPYRMRGKNNLTACRLCDFKSVCRFDLKFPGCAYRSIAPLKGDDFLTRTGGERDAVD